MKTYLHMDGKDIPISEETAQNLRKVLAEKPEREVGLLWDVWVAEKGKPPYILTKALAIPAIYNAVDIHGNPFCTTNAEIISDTLLFNAADLAEAMREPLEENEKCRGQGDYWKWERNPDGHYLCGFQFKTAHDDPALLRRIAATILWLANEAEKEQKCKS